MVRLRSPQVPQEGFSAILVIVCVVLVLSAVAVFFLFKQNPEIKERPQQTVTNLKDGKKVEDPQISQNSDEPPLKLKSIGVNFEDFKFTKEKLQFNRLFMGFGFVIPASPDYPSKSNPQPTFVLPLGTPVRSIVDGVVANMPTLWSGDISIQVTANGKMEKWIYETEHVTKALVKVGDKVKAGQVIAEVGSFGGGDPPGFGAVEIGILKGGNPPEHVCPFAYLDESIKEETFKKMKDLFRSWEEYTGDPTLYEETAPVLGCLTLDPIEG